MIDIKKKHSIEITCIKDKFKVKGDMDRQNHFSVKKDQLSKKINLNKYHNNERMKRYSKDTRKVRAKNLEINRENRNLKQKYKNSTKKIETLIK